MALNTQKPFKRQRTTAEEILRTLLPQTLLPHLLVLKPPLTVKLPISVIAVGVLAMRRHYPSFTAHLRPAHRPRCQQTARRNQTFVRSFVRHAPSPVALHVPLCTLRVALSIHVPVRDFHRHTTLATLLVGWSVAWQLLLVL